MGSRKVTVRPAGRAPAPPGGRTAKTASAGGYYQHGASRTKNSLIGWITGGAGPTGDIDLQASTLRSRARDLYAGGGLGRGAVGTMVTNVVGWGIRPKPKLDTRALGLSEEAADEWQTAVLREFELWAESAMCDATRQHNFWELMELAYLSMLLSGDAFVLFGEKENRRNPYRTVLRLLEADRVSTPESTGESTAENAEGGGRIVDGVKVSREGEIEGYYISTQHPLAEETQEQIEWTFVPAYGPETGMENVLHLMSTERPEQHRGIPFVSGMIEQIKLLDRYLNSELAASIVASMLTVFITSDDTTDDGYDSINDGISEEEKVTDDPLKVELGPGNVYELPPGKKVEHVGINRAPSAFENFVGTLVTMIGAGQEIPYEVLLHRYNSNYTASRGAMLDFWKVVRRARRRFIDRFCQPVYRQWLAEAVALGRVDAPGFFDDPAVRAAWCGCQWIGPSQGHVQPVQEVTAAEKRIALGISTAESEAMAYDGSDWDANVTELQRERGLLPQEEGRSKNAR